MSHAKLKPLDQQVIVVTGASSGIGLATAKLAAQRGAKVVLAARSKEVTEQIVNQINAEGGQAIFVPCDVSDRSQVERLVQSTLQRFGRIDTWINNAGVSIYGRLDQVSEEDSRSLFETNFWGVYNGSLAALPHLVERGGALINIGSEVSEAVVPLQGMYSGLQTCREGFR
jgi:NADP-dependent 3-hydroxy acid dehydrogenase YdfG